jgi:predicted Zn-dependent protease
MERRSELIAILLEARQFDAAETRVRGWLTDDPEQADVQQLLVSVLLAGKKPDAALEAIAVLVPQTPADVIQVLGWRAQAYAQRGQIEEALDDLTGLLQEQFIRENPTVQAELRQDILALLVGAREFGRALELTERWLAEVPAADRVSRLGVLLLKRSVLVAAGRLEEQIPIAEELLAAQPHDPGLNNDLGYTLVERGAQLERAQGMIELAVAAEPLNAAFLDSLGWVYYKVGEFGRARLQLERAVRLRAGQDATVYDHLGDAAHRLGDLTAARQAWEAALALATEGPDEDADARDATLIAALRAKLAAIVDGAPVRVAPTAAEQAAQQQGES